MCSFRRGAGCFPASLPIRQGGRNGGVWGVGVAACNCTKPIWGDFTPEALCSCHIPVPSRAGSAESCTYLGKMQLNITLTPAPSTPWGFPPRVLGAVPASAAEVGPQSKGSRWGFPEKQLGDTQHLKVSLVKSPSSHSTGVLGRGLGTSAGSALPSPRRRRGAGASTLWGGTPNSMLQENGELKAPGNFYQGRIQPVTFGTLWRRENYKGIINFIA